MIFTATKKFDLALPCRVALEQSDYGRQYLFIFQILCFTLQITLTKRR